MWNQIETYFVTLWSKILVTTFACAHTDFSLDVSEWICVMVFLPSAVNYSTTQMKMPWMTVWINCTTRLSPRGRSFLSHHHSMKSSIAGLVWCIQLTWSVQMSAECHTPAQMSVMRHQPCSIGSVAANVLLLFGCSKSFMLSSAGFTCVAFVSGALALWAPEYMVKSLRIQSAAVSETKYVTSSLTSNYSLLMNDFILQHCVLDISIGTAES